MRALDLGALGADAREVVTHTTAAAHGFGGFTQGLINAGVTVGVHTLDAVPHRLHEAVDQGGLDVGARRAHDAARADRAGVQVVQELLLPLGPDFGLFNRSEGSRHAAVQVFEAGLAGLEVFLGQHVLADGLGGGQVVGAHGVVAFHGRGVPEGCDRGKTDGGAQVQSTHTRRAGCRSGGVWVGEAGAEEAVHFAPKSTRTGPRKPLFFLCFANLSSGETAKAIGA